ncbi:MAG: aminoglycoside phosphotransferase family protein [Caulobacteraceae bacterium]
MSDALAPWLARWGLSFESSPAPPGGREPYPGAGEVAFVRRGGQSLVLKLLSPGSDEWRSGEVLAHWDGRGAVRLIEQAPGAVLIERATPGDDLSPMARAGRDAEATLILCGVMAQLKRAPPAAAGFRTVADWGRGFERNRGAAVKLGMDGALIDRGADLFHRMCETQDAPVVLHGDLQHYNVVRDAARGWLAIDPKGVLGEPAYETGAMLRNPIAEPKLCADSAIIERRAHTICAQLGYPYERVIGWCFSQWVLSVLWAIEDNLPFAPSWLDGPLAAQTLL